MDEFAAGKAIGYLGVFSRGVTCSNAAAVLGRDDESDVALRARDLTKLGALSPNGAPGSYEYWALSIRKDASGVAVYPPPVSSQEDYDAAIALALRACMRELAAFLA